MLQSFYNNEAIEAGCDEAGRGCLAGPVFAAAVILPKNFTNPMLKDSKKLSKAARYKLRITIENKATAWSIASASHREIDEINILNASFLAMHRAIDKLTIKPELLLIDGNRFNKHKSIPHICIVKGDNLYYSIAAASVLSKTYRDDFMHNLHKDFPCYNWISNKGYPTKNHRDAIIANGISDFHRKSFNLKGLKET